MELYYSNKVKKIFGEVCIDKSLCLKAGLLERSIPTFVGEWLIDEFCPDGQLSTENIDKLNNFINEHLPTKDQKEEIKNRLANNETLTLIDRFNVTIELKTLEKRLKIPCIDETGYIENYLIDKYPLLLRGGIWGAGRLLYHPPDPESRRKWGEIWLTDFKPLQIASLDLDYYCEQRSQFTLNEWKDVLLNSMGYNPQSYNVNQQYILLTRLIPIVQSRINIVEFAPKGTGKSFIYSNLSRYVRMISGGKVTAAVLFYHLVTNQPGLLTQYDLVVFDETQSISFDNPGEVIGILKDYLESGRFTRGKQLATAAAGIMFLGNIPIGSNGLPREPILFKNVPEFLRETAFIDRLHGLIPGWKLPRISVSSPSKGIGLKADYFSEVLHLLRDRGEYDEYVSKHMKISGTNDMRDIKAIKRITTGYLKLLFPDLKLSSYDFLNYCVKPSVNLRQIIREELAKMDPEYKVITIIGDVK